MLSNVNIKLIPIKAHYFFFNAGTGPLMPFLSLYARQLGFSSVTVGVIYTIIPICGMLAKPSVGAIADRFKCQKGIFLASILLSAAAFWALKYSPEVPVEHKVQFACDGDVVFDTSPVNATFDDCLVENIKKNNGLVDCQLKCPLKRNDWEEINNYWKLKENFTEPYPELLELTAHVDKSSTEQFNKLIVFKVINVTLPGRGDYLPICVESITSVCDIMCPNDYSISDLVATSKYSDSEIYGLYQYWFFLSLMILMWVTQAICVSIGDAICFEMLDDKPHKYGYQRLFGALGWGFITIITGLLVDALSKDNLKKDLTVAFYLAVFFLFLDFLSSTQIKYTQRKHSSNILRDVGKLLTNSRILVFLVWCIAMGMCTGLMWQFLFWLVEDLAKEQGCSSQDWIKTLEGLIMAVETLGGEMPFFFLSGWILKRIGHTNAMNLIPLVIGIRFILYSVIPNPWFFLPIEMLNGLTFGLFYACMASYASIVAPPGTEATMQGLVGAIFEGVGVSLGSSVGGILYKAYKAPWTFRLFGIGSLIVCLLHAGGQVLLKKDNEATYLSPKDAFTFIEDDEQELTPIES